MELCYDIALQQLAYRICTFLCYQANSPQTAKEIIAEELHMKLTLIFELHLTIFKTQFIMPCISLKN